MTGILGMVIPGGIVPMLIGAAALLAVGAAGGAYTAHKLDGTALAQSQAQIAKAQADLSAYEARIAGDAAKANALALQQSDALQARLNQLQSQLAQTQKDAGIKNAKLNALLAAAKPGDVRPLGIVSLAYFDQLRRSAATSPTTNH